MIIRMLIIHLLLVITGVCQAQPVMSQEFLNESLVLGVMRGDDELVERVLSVGAKVNIRDDEGRPALFIATQGRHASLVKRLIEAGADVHAKNQEGKTALSLVHGKRNKRAQNIASILMAAGAAE